MRLTVALGVRGGKRSPGSTVAVSATPTAFRPSSLEEDVEYGAHLPLIDTGTRPTLPALKTYARAASGLGYRFLCSNDHLLFTRPWLDGLTALAALVEESGGMTLATTVSLPVVRGPVQLAKTLAAIDVLSGGRLVAGLGPGSSARDYAAAGVPFHERWRRFDEAVRVVRALLRGEPAASGDFYPVEGLRLEPLPVQPGGPPIWVASWGSDAGLRRVVRDGDGWLASAYNTTPGRFRKCLERLSELRRLNGGQPGPFPNALATVWLYVTEDVGAAERVVTDVLAPMLDRPPEAVNRLLLPVGPAEVCAERLAAFARAGVQRVFVWPLDDEVRQLELFRERVVPLVPDGG
jgi:alkanesulfonate monooxygenase SsuD/methylene tetrahydromethanopterin reductase-like flavin-dependent oxidoreductase (luciferase family)